MKRHLILLWVLVALTASLYGPPSEPEGLIPVRVDGVQLGMEDEVVQARLGRELPDSDCPPQGNHRHRYREGTEVYFNKVDFTAEAIEGALLEVYSPSQGWTPLIRAGDRADTIVFPSRLHLRERSAWLNCLLRSAFQPGEATTTAVGPWVSYQYASEGRESSDSFDFDILVTRDPSARVARVQVVWQGH